MLKRVAVAFVAGAVALGGVFSVQAQEAPAEVSEKLTKLISELSPEQQASLYLTLQSMKGGKQGEAEAESPEAAIKSLVGQVKTALETQNLDLLLETFSDDFYQPQVGGKEEARAMLELGLNSGYADGGEVKLDSMEIEKDDDGSYIVYPIDLTSDMGSVAVELVVKQEESGWKVQTLEVDGV